MEVLPDWLEPVAWTLPSTYVFEGMRSVLFDQVFRWDLLAGAVGLNLLYLLYLQWRISLDVPRGEVPGQTFATRRITPFNFLVTIDLAHSQN